MSMKDQGRHRQGARFQGDPQDGEVMAQRHERHRSQERQDAAHERAAAPRALAAEVPHGVERADEKQQTREREDDEAERVHRNPPIEHGRRRRDPDEPDQNQVERCDRDEPGRPVGFGAVQVGAQRAQQGQQNEREQQHQSRSSDSRVDEIESNSRLM